MKKFNCYYSGNTILGYRLHTPGTLEAKLNDSICSTKPVSNNDRAVDYNCDKKLLKTTYRKRRKVQLPCEETVVVVK